MILIFVAKGVVIARFAGKISFEGVGFFVG